MPSVFICLSRLDQQKINKNKNISAFSCLLLQAKKPRIDVLFSLEVIPVERAKKKEEKRFVPKEEKEKGEVKCFTISFVAKNKKSCE